MTKAELEKVKAELEALKSGGAKPTKAAAPKAAAPKPAKKKAPEPEEDEEEEEEDDFLEWTKKQVGDESGSGLDKEMKKVLDAEGPSSKKLVKMLADKYIEDHSGKRPAKKARK